MRRSGELCSRRTGSDTHTYSSSHHSGVLDRFITSDGQVAELGMATCRKIFGRHHGKVWRLLPPTLGVSDIDEVSGDDPADGNETISSATDPGPSAAPKPRKRRKMCTARQEEIDQALAKMVAVNQLPLAFTASAGFRHFMGVVERSYRPPSVAKLKNRIKLLHNQLRDKIMSQIDEATTVALTTDCWTSRAQDSYITVTAHTLNSEWKSQAFTLATEEMQERHTGENITQRMQEVISAWNLDGKVTAVVTDNASNGINAVNALQGILEPNDVTCSAHSLHLSIKKALANTEINDLCQKSGRLVAHFRHSTVASDELSRRQQLLGLPTERLMQSCPTRWNSTYQMLTKLIKHRSAVQSVLADRTIVTAKKAQNLEISQQEWNVISELCEVLEPLHLATTILCSDTVSPVSMVRPVAKAVLKKLELQSTGDLKVENFKEVVRMEISRRFSLDWDAQQRSVSARQRASFPDPSCRLCNGIPAKMFIVFNDYILFW
ncbi:E3 SUMO-protein ligase ZBED1-like [Dermacentor albipictus]|uniref:E3 SUMO-protein ligase ZBED1-like n=1 Tax=Dermacentor albipictus TaxID=60249 RepID=UPI0038FCBC85